MQTEGQDLVPGSWGQSGGRAVSPRCLSPHSQV